MYGYGPESESKSGAWSQERVGGLGLPEGVSAGWVSEGGSGQMVQEHGYLDDSISFFINREFVFVPQRRLDSFLAAFSCIPSVKA